MASITKRGNGQWRARYRDDTGKEHARHFERKVDAQRWLNEVTASVVTGQYVDPRAGRMTFKEYAETWRLMQVHRPSSQAHYEHLLKRHAYPTFGERALVSILPSDIQAWVKRLAVDDKAAQRRALAPSTIGVVHSVVSSVLKSAVRDRRLASNPCVGSRLPKVVKKQVVPMATEQVRAITEAMPERLRAIVTLAAGTGMRQGECLGLKVDRLNLLRREVVVDQQLLTAVGMPPHLGPPKTAASVRTIPLPQIVVDVLAAHLTAYPAGTDGFVFILDGAPVGRQKFGHLWRPMIQTVGLPKGTGFHALRHYYASLLIRHGESVKTVQARLGHASAIETLDTYSHLWPDSDDRTREAVDTVLGSLADSLRTGDSA